MKVRYHILITAALVVFCVPSLTYARWWNPLTWFALHPRVESAASSTTVIAPVESTPTLVPQKKGEDIPKETEVPTARWWNPMTWFKTSERAPDVRADNSVQTEHTDTASTPPAPKALISPIKKETAIAKPQTDQSAEIEKLKKEVEALKKEPATASISQTPTSPTPVVATWPELESKYFLEATQKGWTSLVITNNAGEKHYYRSEDSKWVRKDTLAESQQLYQPPLPPPTATQIAGITRLCSAAASQGSSEVNQYCTDGTLWRNYSTNIIFRSSIDTLVQKLLQHDQEVANAATNQAIISNYQNAADTAKRNSQLFVQEQNQIDSDATTNQGQNMYTFTVPQSQPQLKCTTQPWWDAGVLRYTTNCNPVSY